jgi:hypothetical protein
MCESEVTVSVPPNESINAIDSEATFDSTLS